jgi:hypothetical protein
MRSSSYKEGVQHVQVGDECNCFDLGCHRTRQNQNHQQGKNGDCMENTQKTFA